MKQTLNLTLIFVAVSLIVLAGLVGGVILTISEHDTTAFYAFFTATLATVVGFAGIIWGQTKIDGKVTSIQANVNGRLTELIALAAGRAVSPAEVARVQQLATESGILTTTDAPPVESE